MFKTYKENNMRTKENLGMVSIQQLFVVNKLVTIFINQVELLLIPVSFLLFSI